MHVADGCLAPKAETFWLEFLLLLAKMAVLARAQLLARRGFLYVAASGGKHENLLFTRPMAPWRRSQVSQGVPPPRGGRSTPQSKQAERRGKGGG